MATTRLMPLHTGKGRTVGQAISAIIDYTENPQKTDGGRLITSWQCDSRIADAEFLFAKNQYTQKTGRVRGEDDVIAYHLRQSFVPGEITPEDANRLGCELAKRFTKGNHAYIVCTHIDKAHIHNHVIWNSTALSQTRKFRNFWGSSRAVRRLNDTICIENGYSIVENPKRHGKSYNKWLGDKKKPSHRERIPCADGLSRQRIHVTLRKPTKPRKEIAMMQPTPKESRIHTDELVDIREVSVDKNLPKEERIAAFIRQIKNPYRFRCGDFVVNACFAGNGVTLEECLQGILR